MATQFESDTDPGVSTLVAGIMNDARDLVLQQLKLFRVEVKNDVNTALRACIPLIIGGAVLLTAMLLLGVGGAYFLCWAFPELPLWGGFAIIGALVALIGAILIKSGTSMLEKIHPPAEQTLEGLKENIQWKTNK